MGNEKKFRVYWGVGYNPTTKVVSEKFFSINNGYEIQDIKKIQQMRVNQVYKDFDPNGTQTIRRVK